MVDNNKSMKKMKILLFMFALVTILSIGCNETNRQPKNGNDITSKADSTKLVSKDVNNSSGTDADELGNIYSSYLLSYRDTTSLDTLIIRGRSNIQINFHHYCLLDSAVHIPSKYTKIYNIEKFITHNFASSLKIKVDDMNVLDTTITKLSFEKALPEYLKSYGVLLYPNISFETPGMIKIDYSISIPLTDVGQSVTYTHKL